MRSVVLTAQQRWAKRHPERKKEIWRNYYVRNRKKLIEDKKRYNKGYRKRNSAKIRIAKKKYHNRNIRKIRAAGKAYYAANRNKRAKANRAWREKNKTNPSALKKITLSSKKSYRKHRKKRLAKNRAWRDKNRALFAFYRMKRRALEKGAEVNLAQIKEFIAGVRSKSKIQCSYCFKVTPIKLIHIDHIIPLCKGGSHSVDNLCVSCKTCNLTKGRQTPETWIRG